MIWFQSSPYPRAGCDGANPPQTSFIVVGWVAVGVAPAPKPWPNLGKSGCLTACRCANRRLQGPAHPVRACDLTQSAPRPLPPAAVDTVVVRRPTDNAGQAPWIARGEIRGGAAVLRSGKEIRPEFDDAMVPTRPRRIVSWGSGDRRRFAANARSVPQPGTMSMSPIPAGAARRR